MASLISGHVVLFAAACQQDFLSTTLYQQYTKQEGLNHTFAGDKLKHYRQAVKVHPLNQPQIGP